ncbi:MAG TPA: cold shock domain-containing protein [Fervidobacterium sp.]|nr:cold shock domain-containing protein [Fervidobacterium sp.]
MKGKITRFFEEKGYGFILDEEGNNRFFHISDVKSAVPIIRYSSVEFTPSQNEKGLTAKEILVIGNSAPRFIQFGDVRVKLNNIKNYGMTSRTGYESVEYERSQGEKVVDGVLTGLSVLSMIAEGGDLYLGSNTRKREVVFDVLYVTTYQGDNYRFSEENSPFNIHEKLKELDMYLS